VCVCEREELNLNGIGCARLQPGDGDTVTVTQSIVNAAKSIDCVTFTVSPSPLAAACGRAPEPQSAVACCLCMLTFAAAVDACSADSTCLL
jgi:hypothetical protein